MPIKRVDGFLMFSHGQTGVPTIGLESEQLSECVSEYHSRGLRGVFAARCWGYTHPHLDVLARLSPLTHLRVWDLELRSIDGIYSQGEDIECLSVTCKRPALDLSRFGSLRELTLNWTRADQGIEDLRLDDFALWHHKPRSKSAEDLPLPAACGGRAELSWSNVSSLEGIAGLSGVRHLELHRFRNLRSLAGIEVFAPTLEKLVVTTSGNVEDVSVVRELGLLRFASVNGEVLVQAPAA